MDKNNLEGRLNPFEAPRSELREISEEHVEEEILWRNDYIARGLGITAVELYLLENSPFRIFYANFSDGLLLGLGIGCILGVLNCYMVKEFLELDYNTKKYNTAKE